MKNLLKIKKCLEYIYEIASEYDDPNGWVDHILYWRDSILKNPEDIIRIIKRCAGGHGSLSDSAVYKDRKFVYEKNVDYSNLMSLMLKLVGDEYDILMGSEKYRSLYPDSPPPPKKDYLRILLDCLEALQELFLKKEAPEIKHMLSLWREGLLNNLEETIRSIVTEEDKILFQENIVTEFSFKKNEEDEFSKNRSDFYYTCHEYYRKLMAVKRYPTLFSEEDL